MYVFPVISLLGCPYITLGKCNLLEKIKIHCQQLKTRRSSLFDTYRQRKEMLRVNNWNIEFFSSLKLLKSSEFGIQTRLFSMKFRCRVKEQWAPLLGEVALQVVRFSNFGWTIQILLLEITATEISKTALFCTIFSGNSVILSTNEKWNEAYHDLFVIWHSCLVSLK